MRKLILQLLAAVAVVFLTQTAHSQRTSPPFTEAPPIAYDTNGAEFLIIIEPNGGVQVLTDTNEGPYDDIDDTLVAVLNLSSTPIAALPLQSPNDIFGFDGDGICTMTNAPNGCPFGPTGYEGPGVTYTNISADTTAGLVVFNPPIPPLNGTAYFGLEDALTTVCQPISAPPLLLECDTNWGINFVGSSTNTFCQMGSYLLSAAMLINYQASVAGTTNSSGGPFTTTPAILNSYLLAHGGYDTNYNTLDCFTAQIPALIAQYAQANGVPMYFYGMIGNRNDFALQQFLCSQEPPLLYVNPPHWVFPIGETNVNGTPTFSVSDPGGFANGSTLQAWDYTYLGMDVFTASNNIIEQPEPLNGIFITAHSPVALLLTDPTGAQVGVDLVNNTPVSTIPLAGYQERSFVNDQNTNQPGSPPVKLLSVVGATNGEYNLIVAGTNTGPFKVDLVAFDTNGTMTSQSVTGTAAPGSFAIFKANYTSTSGTSLTVSSNASVISQEYPAGSNVYVGGEVELCVGGGVGSGVGYHWFQNNAPLSDEGLIAGSQTACLTIGGASGSNNYSVATVTIFGTATSGVVAVTATLPSTVSITRGNYVGLFFPASGVSTENSGYIKISVQSSGKFSGDIHLAKGSGSFTGKFGDDSSANASARVGGVTFDLGLQADTTPGSDRIVGTFTNGSEVVGIYAYLEGKSPAAPTSGENRFTMAMQGGTNGATAPAGWSTFTASMNSAGSVSINAKMADGTAFSQSATTSTTGVYPLFESLYGGKGMMLGWLMFTNDTVNSDSVIWVKPGGLPGQKYFADGFTIEQTLITSPYTPPPIGGNAATLSESYLVLTGGNIITESNNVTFVGDTASFTNSSTAKHKKDHFTITASSGAFSGSFPIPDGHTTKSLSFDGVILQNQGLGYGWFLGTSQGGIVQLQPLFP